MIRALLDQQANPNATNAFGTPVLLLATLQGDAEIVDILLDRGADPKAITCLGETALMYAAYCGDEKLFDLFLKLGNDPYALPHYGQNLLMFAAKGGNPFIFNKSLAFGIDPKEAALGQKNLLMFAIEGGSEEIFDATLNLGIDPLETTNDGETLLMSVFQRLGKNNHAMLLKTLAQNVEINRQNAGGQTALMHAAAHSSPMFVRILLDQGADPTLADFRGRTALDYAKEKQQEDNMKLILKNIQDRPK